MMCTLASRMDENKISQIQKLEKELGTTLLAYTCSNVLPDTIGDDKLKKIQELEQKIGVSLVAIKQ